MRKFKLLMIAVIALAMIPVHASANEEPEYLFDYIGVYSEGMASAGVWSPDWIYGYIDNMAKIVIEPKYKAASGFSLGAAAVGIEDTHKKIKYGFIDKNGTYIVEPKFDETGDFHKIPNTGTEVAMVGVGENLKGRKYGFVLKDGSYFVSPQFDGVSNYWTIGGCGYNVVYNEVNGKKLYGLLDSSGKLIIDTKYAFISVSKYDVAKGYIDVRSDSLYGFYDIKRGRLIEPEYSSVMITTDYGIKTTKKINGKDKVGFYHNNGKVIEPKYDWFWYWDSGNALYKTELNGKYGLLGKNGEELLEPKYDEMRDFGSLVYAVLNGQTILITGDGKPVDDKKFDSIGRLSGFDLLVVEVNGKKGVLDSASNKYLIEPKYDEIFAFFQEGYAKVVLNGKEGIIDRNGKVLLEPVYEYIYPNSYLDQKRIERTNPDGTKFYAYEDDKSSTPVVRVKKDGKEFFLNKDFTPMNKTENSAVGDFDTISIFEGEVARVTKGDKVGYVRKDFTYVVKPVWDSAFRPDADANYFHIQKGGKWGAVFTDGTVIEPVSENMLTIGQNEIAVVTINGKQKYVKKDGSFLNNETYQYAMPFSEGKGLVYPSYSECYFVDTSGKMASEKYMAATSYGEGLAFAFTASGGGRYIDHNGKVVLGETLNISYSFPFKNGIAVASTYVPEKKISLYGLLKKDGTWLLAPTFDKLEIYGDFNYKYYLNGRQAEVTPDGKINWK